MYSIVDTKRSAYRNEIRQKQLNEYFSMKRKMLLNEYNNMEIEHFSFQIVFQNLTEQKNFNENLTILSGLTFHKQLCQQFPNIKESQQLYYDIFQLMIRIISEHSTNNQDDIDQRIKGINIMYNLLADSHCPNSLLTDMICGLLSEFYQSICMWGLTEEMYEVGFLISNLINKEHFAEEIDEMHLTFLLNWVEDLLHIKQQQHISENLYFGLLRMIKSLQKRYRLTNTELPQLYQDKILIFIDITLNNEQILESSISSKLGQRAAQFIEYLTPIILTISPENWIQNLLRYIFKQINSLRKNVSKTLCKILKQSLTFSQITFSSESQFARAVYIRNRIRQLIVQRYSEKIMLFIQFMDIQMKQHIFQVILRIIDCDQSNAAYYLNKFLERNLQKWMIKNFQIKNEEMNIMFFQLINVATDLNMKDCFQLFLNQVEKRSLPVRS